MSADIGEDSLLEPTRDTLSRAINLQRLPSTPWRYLVIVYLPFGLILAFLRLCISLQTAVYLLIVPDAFPLKRYFLRVFQGVLGIVVSTSHTEELTREAEVKVMNRVSGFDHLVIPSVFSTKTISASSKGSILSRLFNHVDLKSDDDQTMVREVEKLVASKTQRETLHLPPLLFQPEPTATNGKSLLLRFSEVPFSVAETVQPVVVRVTRPPGFGAAVATATSSPWADLFWTLFLPYTHFSFQILPPVTQEPDEEPMAFATRVQHLMADCLGIQPSDCTMGDVDKWLQELRLAEETAEGRSGREGGGRRQEDQLPFIPISEYRGMVEPLSRPRDLRLESQVDQVQLVFPQVPRYAIRQDLVRTRNIDSTVLNIADGRLRHDESSEGNPPRARSLRARQEEQMASRTADLRQAQSSPPPQPPPQAVAKKLDWSNLTLEGRKKALVEEARKRYLARHKKS